MAVAFKAAGTAVQNVISSSGVNTPDLTVPLPAGFAAGDFALLAAQNDNLDVIAAPAGWTKIGQWNGVYDPAQHNSLTLFYRFLQAGDSNPVISSPSHAGVGLREVFCAAIVTFTGVLTTGTPYEALVHTEGSGGPVAALTVTTTGADRLVVQSLAASVIQANTPPSGWTEYVDFGTGSGNDGQITIQGIAAPTAGSYSNTSQALVTPFGETPCAYASAALALLPTTAGGFTSTFWTKSAGTWKQVAPLHVRDAGTWKQVQELHVRNGGVWKRIM